MIHRTRPKLSAFLQNRTHGSFSNLEIQDLYAVRKGLFFCKGDPMKLEPIFTVKNKKLYKLADGAEVDTSTLKRIDILWSTVEIEDEAYNEEYLAGLREQLKGLEAAGSFAVLVPVADKPLETPEQEELFINAFNHTARRVKDCISVAGMELAPQLKDKQAFMDTLAIKHAQYVYFTKAENPLSDDIVVY